MNWGSAECRTHVTEGYVLHSGEFVRVFLLAIPPDWASICHDAADARSIDCMEEALMQSPYRVAEHCESFRNVFSFVSGRFNVVIE